MIQEIQVEYNVHTWQTASDAVVKSALSFAVSFLWFNPFWEEAIVEDESMNWNWGHILLTKNVPIKSITDLFYNEWTYSTPSWVAEDKDIYTFVPNTGEIIFPLSHTIRWIGNYKVTYEAWYKFEDLPKDIVFGLFSYITEMSNTGSAVWISSESVSWSSVTYIQNKRFDECRSFLSPYKRMYV